MNKILCFALLLMTFDHFAFASTKVLPIPVAVASPEAQQIRGPHLAFWQKSNLKYLLVTLGGTNSLPADMTTFNSVAAEMGFDVITLDYDNSVTSMKCKESKDTQCFDKYREEIVTGHAVSDIVNVNGSNSLESRLKSTLNWLANNNNTRWNRYLTKKGEVEWSKVIFAGHSQGSGHSAYMAKLHNLKGVVILAGPPEQFSDGREIPWLNRKSETPPHKYFALLHEADFFGSSFQIAAMKALIQSQDISKNVIVSAQKERDPHMALIQGQYTPQWQELLSKSLRP